jgi:acyl-CoA synthetase (AMP-forming)/AMP-acid ligase II
VTPVRGELVEGARCWTAGDLAALEERVSRQLRQEGIGPGARVVVAVRESALYLMTAWGARETGAVVTLLASGTAGAERDVEAVGACLIDSEPDVVLVDEFHALRLASFIRTSGADAFSVAPDGTFARIARAVDRPRTAHPEEAAVICYTSGTERMRKGVLLSRQTLAHLMDGAARLGTYSPDTTFLSCLPLTHMFGFNHTTAALRAGGRVVVCPDFRWLGDVMELIATNRVTAACLVPYQLGRLVAHPAFAALTHLERIWLGGSQVVAQDVEAAVRLVRSLRIGNIYGLTEALRISILWPDDIPRMLPSIGRATTGVEFEIRDAEGRTITTPEARGVGWVRGPTVMLGYWKRAAETDAVLRDGWLCSNDILRRSADGYLWLEGRARQVLSVGGEKLSPEVLEWHIGTACAVAAVAAVAVPTDRHEDEIVAVVVPRREAGAEVTLRAIQAACAPHVRSGFVPQRMVVVDELPFTAEGKLDRGAVLRMLDVPRADDPPS